MKYKVGDKVKIRSWDSMEQEYGLDKNGDIRTRWPLVKRMKMKCNKIVTIKKVYSKSYSMIKAGWSWTDEMIDHVVTRIMSIIDRLEMLKRLTSDNNVKKYIDTDIKNLRSDYPFFNRSDANCYNIIFRKIKGKKYDI